VFQSPIGTNKTDKIVGNPIISIGRFNPL